VQRVLGAWFRVLVPFVFRRATDARFARSAARFFVIDSGAPRLRGFPRASQFATARWLWPRQ
jgi:hypothetical protein